MENGRLVTTRSESVTLPHGVTETVVVRQERWLESDRMIVETIWTAGARTITRRISYRREAQ